MTKLLKLLILRLHSQPEKSDLLSGSIQEKSENNLLIITKR